MDCAVDVISKNSSSNPRSQRFSPMFSSKSWWECKLLQPLWKAVWRFLKKLKIELPYDPAISLLGIHPKKTKALIWKDTCTPMFIAALFTTAKIQKQQKCPLMDEWIKKLWYIYAPNGSLMEGTQEIQTLLTDIFHKLTFRKVLWVASVETIWLTSESPQFPYVWNEDDD